MTNLNDIISVLEKVKAHVTDDFDMVWTWHESGQDFRKEIDSWIERLKQGDTAVLDDIRLAFAPTASSPAQADDISF